MAKKPSYIKAMIKGIAKYPRLNQPDTKFSPGGTFSVKLIVSEADATPLMETINGIIDKEYDSKIEKLKAEGKSPAIIKKVKKADLPCTEVFDEDGNATGEMEFNVKMNHTLTLKDGTVEKRYVKLFDAKGHELTLVPGRKDSKGNVLAKAPSIWAGSVLTAAVQLVPFDSPVAGVGCSLRLSAVQINKLVSGGGGDASSYGFGEDGDYEGSEDEGDSPFPQGEGAKQSDATPEDEEF